ncbi:MAG: ATP-binding cassette domain-containing protein, partial [Enterobacterales bacterium]|nr:ATP-binding cassette domain-containing protein [Enterobacterales bacterium]
SIDPKLSVFDNIADGNEYIQLGNKSRHVIGYLQEFLFAPERVRSPASSLSGGELSRLLLAKLFAKPSNLLILDEPTNDLDMETLEVLEGTLMDYPGTVLLISHDRTFIDNTVTDVIHLDGQGNTSTMVGGYSDWQAYVQRAKEHNDANKEELSETTTKRKIKPTKKKLSYNEQRELELLPEQIETLEQQLAALELATQESDFYNQDQADIKDTFNTITQLQKDIDVAFSRWESLSEES